MKKRFHDGEEVVCVDRNMFPNSITGMYAPDLSYKGKYIIDQYDNFRDGHWWLKIIGIQDGAVYSENSFCKLTEATERFESHIREDLFVQHMKTLRYEKTR